MRQDMYVWMLYFDFWFWFFLLQINMIVLSALRAKIPNSALACNSMVNFLKYIVMLILIVR